MSPIVTLIIVALVGFLLYAMLIKVVGNFLAHAAYTGLLIYAVVTLMNVSLFTVFAVVGFIMVYITWFNGNLLVSMKRAERGGDK